MEEELNKMNKDAGVLNWMNGEEKQRNAARIRDTLQRQYDELKERTEKDIDSEDRDTGGSSTWR